MLLLFGSQEGIARYIGILHHCGISHQLTDKLFVLEYIHNEREIYFHNADLVI